MIAHATLAQIAEALGISKQAAHQRAAKGQWPYEERPERGGMVRYYVVAELPTKVAQALNQKHWKSQVVPPSAGDAGSVTGPFELDDLKTWAQSRAIRLTPKELADPRIAAKLAVARALEECPPYLGRVALADTLAATHKVTRITIYRWWEEVKLWRVKAKTQVAQAGKVSIELPKSRAFDADALAWGVANHAHHLNQGRKWAYGKLQAKAAENGWKIGDYTSFCRLLNEIPTGIWDYIRKGPTGFELQAMPKITRAWLETPAYSVLCGDQNVLDYLVLDELTGEILVMNLYLWMDCTSRAWTGMWPSFGPYRAYTVGYSLREAVRLGLPGEIFTDWGKCELSNYVADVRQNLSRYCGVGDYGDMEARYGSIASDSEIKHRKTPRPREPWKKPIENQMNILKRGLLDLDLPGYRQKLAEPWANEVRQMELRVAMKRGHLLTLDQMLESLLSVLERHNREACKLRELHGDTIVPGHVLADGLRARNLTTLNNETLDYLFLPKFERTASRGVIAAKIGPHDTRSFFCSELSKATGAARKVAIYVDPHDIEAPARIATLSGDFIGLGEPWNPPKVGDKDALSRQIATQRRLLKSWREGVNKIMAPYTGNGTERIGPFDGPARQAGKAEQERQAINEAKERADQRVIELFGRGKRA